MEKTVYEIYQAYLNTVFISGSLQLFPNKHNPGLGKAVQGNTWAIITSDNPESKIRPDSENTNSRILFKKDVAALHLLYHRANGMGQNWPVESGFMIYGISLEEAKALARKYGQYAILYGEGDDFASLVWLGPV